MGKDIMKYIMISRVDYKIGGEKNTRQSLNAKQWNVLVLRKRDVFRWEPDRGLMKRDTETLRQHTLVEDVFCF